MVASFLRLFASISSVGSGIGGADEVHIPEGLILSFAEIASATMSLRCNAFITVMETAQLRDRDDPADARIVADPTAFYELPGILSRPVFLQFVL